MIDKMMELAYDPKKIEAKMAKFIRKVPQLYHVNSMLKIKLPLARALKRAEKREQEKRDRQARLEANRVLNELQ